MNKAKMSEAEKWREYERRKAALRRKYGINMNQRKYEKAIAAILQELGL